MWSFAELLVFIGALLLLTYLMRPLQRYLEPRLRKYLNSKKTPHSVIDITDYAKAKKDKPK